MDGGGRRGKGMGGNFVYADLRARILSLELAPGAHLDEAGLVEDYGVSRTLVREALIRLGSSGLAVLLPNRGARVAPIEVAGLSEFFEALDLCERSVAHWAALRRQEADVEAISCARRAFEAAAASGGSAELNTANLAFHLAIARAADNSHIAGAYARLLEEEVRVRWLSFGVSSSAAGAAEEHTARAVADHRALETAIRDGDAIASQETAAAHVLRFRDRVIASLGSRLSDAIPIVSPASGGGATLAG